MAAAGVSAADSRTTGWCSAPTNRSSRRGPRTCGATSRRSRSPRSGTRRRSCRDRQRNWAMYAPAHHRRAKLIAGEAAARVGQAAGDRRPVPTAPLGSWTLLEPDVLLAATDCSSPFPNGEARLRGGSCGPAEPRLPQALGGVRAARRRPGARRPRASISVPAPAAGPGCSRRLGAHVLAVDKAPLVRPSARCRNVAVAPRKRRSPSTRDRQARRLAVLRHHLLSAAAAGSGAAVASTPARRRTSICTIKFQGATDLGIVRTFAAIPGAAGSCTSTTTSTS